MHTIIRRFHQAMMRQSSIEDDNGAMHEPSKDVKLYRLTCMVKCQSRMVQFNADVGMAL
jgi:hypothetical protein